MTAATRWRDRVRVFLLFTLALIALELSHDVYRLFAYAEERTQLRALSGVVDGAGVEVIRTQLRADSVRARLAAMDAELDEARKVFALLDDRAANGRYSRAAALEYRARVAEYNEKVAVRNYWIEQWEGVLADNREAVRRYNDLADEMRSIAATMGELHYNVPSPVEAAVRNGLRPE